MPNLWGVVAAGTLRMHDEGVFAHFSSEHACVNRVHANSIAFACKFQGCRLGEQRYSAFVIEENGSCCKPTMPAIEARLTIALPCSLAFAASRRACAAAKWAGHGRKNDAISRSSRIFDH